jgi:hypothetical protein
MAQRKKVNEAVARPARTAVQATPAFLITSFIDSTIWDMNDETFGLVVLILTTVFSFVQTAIENSRGKGLMRNVPPKEAPVIDDKAV